ncbi:hypothetical protein ACA910_006787 [Epithemia clementina (nom. ined.)]
MQSWPLGGSLISVAYTNTKMGIGTNSLYARLLRCSTTSPYWRSHTIQTRVPQHHTWKRTRTTVQSFSSSSLPTQPSLERRHQQLPNEANVVVVGGGVIGTSVAYHLGKLGVKDVLLLERDRLTSGTTWHAAGLMNSFGSLSSTSTWMRQYTQELYRDILPSETGLETGYMPIGFIELACDVHRLEQYRRIAAFNRYCGVNVSEISPQQVQEHFPLCDISSVLAGFYVPTDGRANPTDVTLALAKGARQNGVQIVEQCPVLGVVTESASHGQIIPKVSGVRVATTGAGSSAPEDQNGEANSFIIKTNKVVNCTGMWARQFGNACGVFNLPNQAAEHYYMITEPIPEMDLSSWPVIEDSSRCTYIRPEGGGLMLGLFEWHGAAAPWKTDKVPSDFSFGQLEPDWERMVPYLERAMELVPAVENVGVKSLFCGPESFTPDSSPMVGESPELRGYYVGAGLNSLGILTGGGLGHLLAQWVQKGHAPDDMDVTCIHVNRFHRYQSNPKYRHERVGEALGTTYKVHYPDYQLKTCRNVRQSALHERLAAAGAYFRSVSGWESPAWYAGHGGDPAAVLEKGGGHSFGREPWFDYWAAEHHTCRQAVALFDMTFMSKFLVQGRDAGKFLNWLSTANVLGGDSGTITYTQWLNERGFMEADVTVTKWTETEYWVMVTDTMHNHVLQHMHQRLRPDDFVTITDVTARYVQLNVQGPKSRGLLQQLTSHDMSKLDFRQVTELDIGLARVLCARITYVGELGYELYIPVEQCRHVYDQIVEKGQMFGLKNAGLRALGSLRMEKAYRDYGHDMDNSDTLLECGLGFTCDFGKSEGPFIGQDKVEAQKEFSKQQGGLFRRLVSVWVTDPEPLMHGGEVLWRDGQRFGDVRAASFGHTLGGAVGLSMLSTAATTTKEPINKTFLNSGDWQVEIANSLYPCQLSLVPFYDPKSLRVHQ